MSPRDPTESPVTVSGSPEVRRSVRAWIASSIGPAAATRAMTSTSESASTNAPRRHAVCARAAALDPFMEVAGSEANADREDEGVLSVRDHVLDLTVRLHGH